MGAVQLRVACSHVQVAASRAGGALAAATWMAHEPLACVHTSARHSLPFNICLFAEAVVEPPESLGLISRSVQGS